MGVLRSTSDLTGLEVNGTLLGEPTFTDDMAALPSEPVLFAWSHQRLPSGVVNEDGSITLDQAEEI